ncbi:MAG: hypothetical protein ABIW46_04700 [Acidimicrobiales bacterium]
MAFGQRGEPPAPARQVQELLTLLRDAGHVDFRDARGPMGLTQRQAAGKFSREEVAELIARLQDSQGSQDATGPQADAPPAPAPAPRLSSAEQALRRIPPEQLAAELRRRGWSVVEP